MLQVFVWSCKMSVWEEDAQWKLMKDKACRDASQLEFNFDICCIKLHIDEYCGDVRRTERELN